MPRVNVDVYDSGTANGEADVANAFNTTLNRLGFEKDSRCGYAIGISYPPDWGERTMSPPKAKPRPAR